MEFKTVTTLGYVINDKSEVLLIFKKRGFGQGKWNGPGGKVKPGELPMDSIAREIKEETDIEIFQPAELGYIEFIWPSNEMNQRCHIFRIRRYAGEPKESEECIPAWFSFDAIPYDKMWDDDKYWYPKVLAGEKFKMRFYFNETSKIIKHEKI